MIGVVFSHDLLERAVVFNDPLLGGHHRGKRAPCSVHSGVHYVLSTIFQDFSISNQHLVYKETKVITVVKGDPRKRCSELGSGWSGYGSAFGVEVGCCPTLSGLHCTKRSCSLVQLGVNRKQVPLFRDSSFSNDRPIDKQLEVGAVVDRGPGKGRPGRRSAGNILQGVVKIEVFNCPVLCVPPRRKRM